jgi:hypothetical protein
MATPSHKRMGYDPQLAGSAMATQATKFREASEFTTHVRVAPDHLTETNDANEFAVSKERTGDSPGVRFRPTQFLRQVLLHSHRTTCLQDHPDAPQPS